MALTPEALKESHRKRVITSKAKYGDDYFKIITAKGRANREYKKGVALNSGRTHFKKGTPPWNKGLKGYRAGAKSHLWRGGVQSEIQKARSSFEYREWRKAVFEKDNYTCVWCGESPSGKLNADHIKPFALFPELRYDLSNGRTLCIDCHKKTPSYMKRYNDMKREDYL